MKIKDIILYLENNQKTHTVADEFVNSGYGQTTGGYLKNKNYHPSQLEHFINYYCKHAEASPTFTSLWCPELMLFIAESLGVNQRHIENASKLITTYEDKFGLKNSKKKATYLPTNVLTEFKRTLKLYDLCAILKKNDDWKTIEKEISKL